MKQSGKNAAKELYARLRKRSPQELWNTDVAEFDRATPEERFRNVAVVRAVGVVFSESGNETEKAAARNWLRKLLRDPSEKVRRYAIAALPKVGAEKGDEQELLRLTRRSASPRERKSAGQALAKFGGRASLEEIQTGAGESLRQMEQKLRAAVLREETSSGVKLEAILSNVTGVKIHLHSRRGLEGIVRQEAEAHLRKRGGFRVGITQPGLVTLSSLSPFCLADLYQLRCFGSLGLVLGSARDGSIEALASIITSPLVRHIFQSLTEGPFRYRLDFVSKGHQRGTVRQLAELVYAKAPELLNDPRNAPWTIAVEQVGREALVELRPRLTLDPRFNYRQADVPAASHPPLAACIAWLAGKVENDVVWDPFLGSGLELIERALRGGARELYGTDLSAEAVEISRKNFSAANLALQPKLMQCDFHEFATQAGLGPGSLSLIITNPPLGKRVPIPDLRGMIEDLFKIAANLLKPGGRLVLANPLRSFAGPASLELQFQQAVDFGGFDCRLERYQKRNVPTAIPAERTHAPPKRED